MGTENANERFSVGRDAGTSRGVTADTGTGTGPVAYTLQVIKYGCSINALYFTAQEREAETNGRWPAAAETRGFVWDSIKVEYVPYYLTVLYYRTHVISNF